VGKFRLGGRNLRRTSSFVGHVLKNEFQDIDFELKEKIAPTTIKSGIDKVVQFGSEAVRDSEVTEQIIVC